MAGFDAPIGGWFWAPLDIFTSLLARTVDEMSVFGKITSVLFAEGLFILCFLVFWYLVAHNKTFQSTNDNATFFLLALLLISTVCAVCLCVATVLGYIVKTLRAKKESQDEGL